MWRHPWQSASVRTTLTHLLSWMPQELCTEIRSSLAFQSQQYSSYKSRTTLKGLIGIFPNGSISFVGELWSGPISDRELVIKSVMFCISKKFYHHIHKQCYLSTFFFLTFWLPSSVACWFAWLLHKHHVLSFKKKNSNHRIHKHCSLSIPLFSNFFRVCWFGWLIFKKLFSSHSRALLLSFTFLFQQHLRFFGKWFVISRQTVGTLFSSLLYRKY